MKKIICLALLSLIFTTYLFAQDANNPVAPNPGVVGPLPNAASLGKYGDVPIGLYTGTLQYNLPLINYQTKHLSVPILLNYATNGVKVDEEDSKVGINWALSAGGVITRTVYNTTRSPQFGGGVPPPPPANVGQYYPSQQGTDPTSLLTWLGYYPQTDTQLDEFNFNFGAYSGKFVLTQNNGVYTATQLQYSNLKIECNYSQSVGTGWIFRITTPDGVAYYFGENYATESTNTVTSSVGPINNDNSPPSQLSAFFLTRIVHPYDPTDIVYFHYSNHNNNYTSSVTAYTRYLDISCPCSTQGSGSVWCPSCSTSPCVYGGPEIWNAAYEAYAVTANQGIALRLDAITSTNYGSVNFSYVEKPNNAAFPGLDCILSQVSLYSPSQQLLKSYKLDYYFSGGNVNYLSNNWNNPSGGSFQNPINLEPRSFLIDVKENDANNNQVKITKFSYNDVDNMAPRLSFAQDAYGYFNGIANVRFIPNVDGFQVAHNVPYADRSSNFTYAVKGTLSQIIYPTGGYSNFTYEAHSSTVGGVRIKEVDTYDPASQVTTTKNYTYSPAVAIYQPNFRTKEQHMNNLFVAPFGGCYPVTLPQLCTYIVLSSGSTTPLSGRGGFYIYYQNVNETDGVGGVNGGIEHYYHQNYSNTYTPPKFAPRAAHLRDNTTNV